MKQGRGRGSVFFSERAARACTRKRARSAIDRDLDHSSLPDPGRSTSHGVASNERPEMRDTSGG